MPKWMGVTKYHVCVFFPLPVSEIIGLHDSLPPPPPSRVVFLPLPRDAGEEEVAGDADLMGDRYLTPSASTVILL